MLFHLMSSFFHTYTSGVQTLHIFYFFFASLFILYNFVPYCYRISVFTGFFKKRSEVNITFSLTEQIQSSVAPSTILIFYIFTFLFLTRFTQFIYTNIISSKFMLERSGTAFPFTAPIFFFLQFIFYIFKGRIKQCSSNKYQIKFTACLLLKLLLIIVAPTICFVLVRY